MPHLAPDDHRNPSTASASANAAQSAARIRLLRRVRVSIAVAGSSIAATRSARSTIWQPHPRQRPEHLPRRLAAARAPRQPWPRHPFGLVEETRGLMHDLHDNRGHDAGQGKRVSPSRKSLTLTEATWPSRSDAARPRTSRSAEATNPCSSRRALRRSAHERQQRRVGTKSRSPRRAKPNTVFMGGRLATNQAATVTAMTSLPSVVRAHHARCERSGPEEKACLWNQPDHRASPHPHRSCQCVCIVG